ncbi:hypothetical protein HFD88_005714 [Aspergillus terreus]|nr:hypothetical protein HFD88_005714 [Aspergillus terreus]
MNTDENTILLHGAGLQLYVYYLLDNGQSDLREKGLVRAYNLATELITTFTTLASAYELPEHGPVSYFRALCLAAMFILRLCYSNMSGSLDIDSGKGAFSSAICLTRRISLEDNDLPGRMSRILTQLWSAQVRSGSRDKDPGLKLKTRMAASLIHDSLWMWREEFGGQRNTAQTPPVGIRNPGLAVQNLTLGSTQDEAAVEVWTLEDMIDAEMLALLPFSLDGEP